MSARRPDPFITDDRFFPMCVIELLARMPRRLKSPRDAEMDRRARVALGMVVEPQPPGRTFSYDPELRRQR